jgi:cytochrome c6
MKKLLTALALFLSVALFQAFAFTLPFASAPAMAADSLSGAQVFQNNCAMCHVGGKNVVMPDKTLDQAALDRYGKNSIAAITAQIKAGMNAMPAFKDKLTDAQIEDVAAYVLQQAENGWQ